ncbi:MAG: aryl-sulfate sulfotransferase [Planctomycetota bacterium]
MTPSNSASNMHNASKLAAIVWLALVVTYLAPWSNAFAQEKPGPLAATDSSNSILIGSPTVRKNPIERCPLVAIVDFKTSQPVVSLESTTTDGTNSWKQEFEKPQPRKLAGDNLVDPARRTYSYSVAIMGLRPDREHEIELRLALAGDRATETVDGLSIRTPPLPKSFPPLRVLRANPDEMEPGITFFAVNFWRDSTSMLDYGFIIAVDERGEVVWFCKTDDRIADMRVTKNGRLLYQQGSYRYAYEIDMLGRDHRRWVATNLTFLPDKASIPVEVDTLHHELQEINNGNFMTLATELRRFQEYPTTEFSSEAPWAPAYVVCDRIIEFDPDSGKIEDQLYLSTILDRRRFGYMALSGFWKDKYNIYIGDEKCRDWSHANALVYLADENAVIVSFRHLDCVLKLDWETKKIRWILGNPSGWGRAWQKYLLKPVGDVKWAYHQHAPQITPRGTLMMYDNGNYRARPFDKATFAPDNRSRVVEYKIDEDAMTVEQVYEYDGGTEEKFYCPFYGEAEWLPQTGNILITDGGHIELKDGTPNDNVPGERQWARIFEIDRETGKKVFEITFRSPLGSPYGWSIYRAMRRPNLFDGFDLSAPTEDEDGNLFSRARHVRRNRPLNAEFQMQRP